MVAAASGRIAAMRVLMDEAKVGVDRRDPAGWTALMYAAASGRAEAARVLLAGGADRSLRNNAGRTAEDLGLAAPRGPMNLSQRR
jgi:ankyrin repeat protein